MSESRSASKSHDSFNRDTVEVQMHNLFQDDNIRTNFDYIELKNRLRLWLRNTDIDNMHEKALQRNFYEECMKVYKQNIGDELKYTDGFKGTIFRSLFERLMPDFCRIDYYNLDIRSSTSSLDVECLPIHIISVLELKKDLQDSNIGQLVHYLRIILDYSPGSRLFIMGAMTDFHDIRFAKVSRSIDGDNIEYTTSAKALDDEYEFLLHYLTTFFIADPSKFGYCRLSSLSDHIRIHNRLLGIGASSMVFNCFLNNDQTSEYVLKISNKSVDKEVSIYKELYSDKYRIIKVHEYALLFLHPPGRNISKENLLNNIDVIWKQIKKTHEIKFLHCDIRRSNIIELFNNKTNSYEILLIDWGSSIKIGCKVKYNGTLSTASTYILKELSNNRNRSIEYLRIDDCISFMKMILLEIISEKYKKAISSKVQQGSLTGIIVVYDQIKDSFKTKQPIIMKVIEFLEKYRSILNDEKLNSYIDQCINHRHCLIQLENEQINIDYFNDLERNIFSS